MKINEFNYSKFLIKLYGVLILIEYILAPMEISWISKLITFFLACLGLVYIVIFNKLTQELCIKLIIVSIPVVYAHSIEGVRYTLLFYVLISWGYLKTFELVKLVKFIVIFGTLTSVGQIFSSQTSQIRIEGFTVGSPPQFACYMFACLIFLWIYELNNKTTPLKMYGYNVICTILIFLTGTRTIIVAAALMSYYFIIAIVIQKVSLKQKKFLIFSIILISVFVAIILFEPLMNELNVHLGRNAQSMADSNRTRNDLYFVIINDFMKNRMGLIIGHGSGYVEKLIKNTYGLNEYLPVHQDFLLLLSEFGIIGYFALYYSILKKYKEKIIFFILFVFSSFHNVILNTKAMVLFILIMTYMEQNEMSLLPSKLRRGA